MADVERAPRGGKHTRLPWEAPVRDAGENGEDFVPGGLNHHCEFWDKVILRDHPDRHQLMSYLRDGVSVFDFLTEEYRGRSRNEPYRPEAFPGAVFPNRIPDDHAEFVTLEVQQLTKRGCLARWADVKGPNGPDRPRMVLSISVEPTKPRMIINGIPLNKCCRHVPFTMDTVSRVAVVAEEGVFMGSLDDRAGFHNLGLQPESWPLFGVHYEGVDYVCTTLPFGWNESPVCYHSLSEAKAAYLRSRGIPVLAYIDDAWYANFAATFGKSRRVQWLSAAEALHTGILVSYKCGYFLSIKKCDLYPSQQQRYLGIICDSRTTSYRIPEDKLHKLHALISKVLADGSVSVRMLEKIVGKCVSMSVAIRPASLWTHYMFAAIKKAKSRVVQLKDKHDLRAELRVWLKLSSTSQEEPWYKSRHYDVSVTTASSDASSNGGVVSLPSGRFSAGGGFPPEWLLRPINGKEMFALLEVLKQCCRERSGELRRDQVLMDVDNRATVDAFRKGRSSNLVTHAMLVSLFELQVAHGFWLTLRWVPSAENAVADNTTRPGRQETVCLKPAAFERLRQFFGDFTVDLVASSENAQYKVERGTGAKCRLPFFSRYSCEGTAGVDVLRQDVAVTPGLGTPAFGYCFPPPVMVGHVIQHLAECRAHAVIVIPDVHDYWLPRVGRATVKSLAVSRRGSLGYPHHQDGVREYVYPRHGMRAVELDFRHL